MMTHATPTPWSEWLVAALRRPVHGADRERAALHLIDWLGCAHLGQTTELGAVLQRWAQVQAPGPIWVCGHPGLQAAEAARWHGTLGNRLPQQSAALTYYTLMSVGPLLALAASRERSGERQRGQRDAGHHGAAFFALCSAMSWSSSAKLRSISVVFFISIAMRARASGGRVKISAISRP